MARVTVEDCLDKLSNRFALVHLVAKRSKQLMKGAPAVVTGKDNKQIVSALREVAAGSVYLNIDESLGTPDQQVERDIKD